MMSTRKTPTKSYEFRLASQSPANEATGKDVFGSICEVGHDIVTCYVTNRRTAELVLTALNRSEEDER